MKLRQRQFVTASGTGVDDEAPAPFPFDHVVAYFDHNDYAYPREGPTAVRAGFPFPEEIVAALPEHVRDKGRGFVLGVRASGPVCDLQSYPLAGLLGERSVLLEAVNEWNGTRRLPRAALDADGDVRLDLSLLSIGATSALVDTACGLALAGTAEFAAFVLGHGGGLLRGSEPLVPASSSPGYL